MPVVSETNQLGEDSATSDDRTIPDTSSMASDDELFVRATTAPTSTTSEQTTTKIKKMVATEDAVDKTITDGHATQKATTNKAAKDSAGDEDVAKPDQCDMLTEPGMMGAFYSLVDKDRMDANVQTADQVKKLETALVELGGVPDEKGKKRSTRKRSISEIEGTMPASIAAPGGTERATKVLRRVFQSAKSDEMVVGTDAGYEGDVEEGNGGEVKEGNGGDAEEGNGEGEEEPEV